MRSNDVRACLVGRAKNTRTYAVRRVLHTNFMQYARIFRICVFCVRTLDDLGDVLVRARAPVPTLVSSFQWHS